MQQSGKLSAKLVGIQVFFLAVALVSIGLTLLVSWRLEGSAAAINDAVHKIEQTSQESMSGMTAGLNLPPGFKLPF